MVYVVRVKGTDRVYIGYTHLDTVPIHWLQNSNPEELVVEHVFPLDGPNAANRIRLGLEERSIRNFWFTASQTEVAAVLARHREETEPQWLRIRREGSEMFGLFSSATWDDRTSKRVVTALREAEVETLVAARKELLQQSFPKPERCVAVAFRNFYYAAALSHKKYGAADSECRSIVLARVVDTINAEFGLTLNYHDVWAIVIEETTPTRDA